MKKEVEKLQFGFKKYFDMEIKLEEITCVNCSLWKDCEYAFDSYNIYGDCLAEK